MKKLLTSDIIVSDVIFEFSRELLLILFCWWNESQFNWNYWEREKWENIRKRNTWMNYPHLCVHSERRRIPKRTPKQVSALSISSFWQLFQSAGTLTLEQNEWMRSKRLIEYNWNDWSVGRLFYSEIAIGNWCHYQWPADRLICRNSNRNISIKSSCEHGQTKPTHKHRGLALAHRHFSIRRPTAKWVFGVLRRRVACSTQTRLESLIIGWNCFYSHRCDA